VIVGSDIEVRDMSTGEQAVAAGPDDAVTLVERSLA
jgi:hypothetical protein